MIVRVYTKYGSNPAEPIEVRSCSVPELGVELMSLFLMYGSVPMHILFKKGERNAECVIIITKEDRRQT